MTRIDLEGPAAVTLADGAAPGNGVAARDARLLVAGEYPAKGLTVTEADIDALVAHFAGPVPVKVEHMDTPLDPLGQVERVWRDGDALMGRIAFPAALAAFLAERGAEKLSVGLLGAPAWQLLETSLTLRPHVPSATLLSDGDATELARLRAERREGRLAGWKAAGKLTPAAEPWARALLAAPGVVTLSEGADPEPVGEVFGRFLEAQPPVVTFAEVAPAQPGPATLSGGASGAAAFTADEAELLRRLGVDPAAVAETMAADRRRKENG